MAYNTEVSFSDPWKGSIGCTIQLKVGHCVAPKKIYTTPKSVFRKAVGLKGQMFKGKYKAELEFPEKWSMQNQKLSREDLATHCPITSS